MTLKLHSTWRSECGRYSVAFSQSCVDDMMGLAKKHFPLEVGTSLVGIYSDDGYVATVTGLAPLAHDSKGGRFTFTRGAAGLGEFFRQLFHRSGGREHYVGDWHSHPGGAPSPSSIDSENAAAIADDDRALCPECILAILALDERSSELGVFVYSRKHGRIVLGTSTSAPGPSAAAVICTPRSPRR
jgi:proteasome lid subunit RPN8/RPN11